MSITGKTFKLSKEAKRQLATVLDNHARGRLKEIFIKGEVAEAEAAKMKLKFKHEAE